MPHLPAVQQNDLLKCVPGVCFPWLSTLQHVRVFPRNAEVRSVSHLNPRGRNEWLGWFPGRSQRSFAYEHRDPLAGLHWLARAGRAWAVGLEGGIGEGPA